MKLEGVPFSVIDWLAVTRTKHPGERGEALWRTYTLPSVNLPVSGGDCEHPVWLHLALGLVWSDCYSSDESEQPHGSYFVESR